jgi:hypothetical protein
MPAILAILRRCIEIKTHRPLRAILDVLIVDNTTRIVIWITSLAAAPEFLQKDEDVGSAALIGLGATGPESITGASSWRGSNFDPQPLNTWGLSRTVLKIGP